MPYNPGMDQLVCMRSFVRVADLHSFTRAADALGISRAVVSTHVAELERHLRCQLFHRTTRRVGLTSDGAEYLARCQRVLAELEAAGLIVLADKGYQGAAHAKVPYKGKNKPESQKDANRAHAKLRAPGERANAQLKNWHILRKLGCCPWRAGQLAKAIHALEIHAAQGGWKRFTDLRQIFAAIGRRLDAMTGPGTVLWSLVCGSARCRSRWSAAWTWWDMCVRQPGAATRPCGTASIRPRSIR